MAAELGWPRNVATDMPVLEIMDGSAGVVKLIPQELIERQTVEETVDVLVPQTQELPGSREAHPTEAGTEPHVGESRRNC